MKPCVRFLQRFTHTTHCKSQLVYLNYHHRTILEFATDTSNPPISTQYPPPPLQERYSKLNTQPTPNAKIEPYKDVQFKPKDSSDSKIPNAGNIPLELQDNNVVDKQTSVPSSPEEELSLGGVNIDPLELRKMIPHGTASKEEIESAISEENMEWKGVHWSERQYTAKLGDIVNRQRPKEISEMMESSKPSVHKQGLRSIKPVEAGGVAYPIFYDPKSGDGLNRAHTQLPKDIEGRKSRVTHIASLQKVTGLNHSECALEYDYSKGQYSIALERLRDKQVRLLSETTQTSKEECKKIFDQCLGNFDKALRKLRH